MSWESEDASLLYSGLESDAVVCLIVNYSLHC